MSSTRRQDLGLGKTAKGGSGGSFASHERGAAAPPPSSAAPDVVISEPFTVRWTERDVLLSPRHRKPRDIDRSFEMDAEVRSISREDTGEAFTMHEFIGGSGDMGFEVRHYDGELYRPMVAGDIWSYTNTTMEPPYPNRSDRLEATPERIRERLTRFERDYETGELVHVTQPYQRDGNDSEAGARDMVQAEVDGYLVVDGELWRKTEEPVYRVNIYGMGSNHGGTGFSIDNKPVRAAADDESGLIRADNVFTLDEFEAAKTHALKTARGRGDTESIQHIEALQPITVAKDRPWSHPKAAARISEYTGPHDIPYEQRHDYQVHHEAFISLKRGIQEHAPHAIHNGDDGRQRVDFTKLTESVERDYKALSRKVRELSFKDDEF